MIIKGIPIILYEQTESGKDGFNRPIIVENPIVVENVVVGQPTSEDITSEFNVSGKTVSYNLAIPRDDEHDWTNKVVEFYGRKWKTIGIPTQYIDDFYPKSLMQWNKKVRVESYE